MTEDQSGTGEFRFEREQWLPRELEEVFRFFAETTNLEALTPPELHFKVVGCSTASMGGGTLIDYRLRMKGIPLGWRSRIRQWKPPHSFVDEQVRGPYRSWIHTHSFEEQDAGVLVRDSVRYTLPVPGIAAPWVDRWFVRPNLERIFAYRQERLEELFGTPG